MGFGDKGTKSFGGNTAKAFEAAAQSELAGFAPVNKEDAKTEVKTIEKKKVEEPQINKEDSKKEKKTKASTQKTISKTKDDIYSLRVEFPKELEPVLKLAGKAHGTMKDYIMELIYNDLEKNIENYKDQKPEDPNKWKKFL